MEHIDKINYLLGISPKNKEVKEEINDWNNFIFARQKVAKEEKQRKKHKEHLKRVEELHKQARR